MQASAPDLDSASIADPASALAASSSSSSSSNSSSSSSSSSAASSSPDTNSKSKDLPHLRTVARYRAALLLGALGDTLGYHNGDWEFCYDTQKIRDQFELEGGLDNISLKKLIVSDDTVFHMATIEAMLKVAAWGSNPPTLSKIAERKIACELFVEAYDYDMKDRAPGMTTGQSIAILRTKKIPSFNVDHRTCGGSMRAAGIGLRYARVDQYPKLLWTSIEYCRLTHNGPIAYLGSYLNALFTSYAINRISPTTWLVRAIQTKDQVMSHIRDHARTSDLDQHIELINWAFDMLQIYQSWRYPDEIRLSDSSMSKWDSQFPYFTQTYENPTDVSFMDQVYRALSNNPKDDNHHWAGSGGLSSVLIAYDALVNAMYNHETWDLCLDSNLYGPIDLQHKVPEEYWKQTWSRVVKFGMLHSGDNDSTGIIIGGWYGALFGARGVTRNLLEDLEYFDYLWSLAEKLHATTQ